MIPSTTGFLEEDFEIEEQPTHTYKMDLRTKLVRGYIDGQEAMKQALYKIWLTERYQYPMYSWNYGMETLDLYGEPLSYVCPEIERRTREAFMCDTRVTDVSDFTFDTHQKGSLHVSCVAHTIFGEIALERVVNY